MIRAFWIIFGLVPGLCSAQLPFDWPLETGARYSASVPTPDKALGFRIGTRHIRSHEVVEYFRAVDASSDRVQTVIYGRSVEQRPMILAFVSHPDNLKNLDGILAANRRLTEDAASVTDAEIAKMPAVLWAGYGVHGNEASSPDAACLFLYHLAAGNIENDLKNVVLVVAPDYNPDGRDRFVDWANGFRGKNATADTNDLEHNSPWPGGRTNHYWFDLNRDWMPLTQPESSTRHAYWVKCRPQVTLDFHEMGGNSTYFFQPGVANRVNRNTPASNQAWTQVFATYHARAMESVKELYFTGERYDDFYVGKGSTYTDMAGSIGILFEQASARSLMAPGQGRILDFGTTVRNQVACSLSSLKATLENRVGLLKYQRDYYRDLPVSKDRVIRADERGKDLVRLLLKHGIKVYESGDGFVVPGRQPQIRLINAFFDRTTTFDDTGFYDISSWALDYAMGATMEMADGANLGREVTEASLRTVGSFRDAEKALGYVVRAGRDGFHRAVYEIQGTGRNTYFVTKPVGTARPGDLFVPATGSGDAALMKQVAERFRVDIVGVAGQTGEVTSWGGTPTSLLERPRIALIAGSGTDSNNAGEMWWYLDTVQDLPISVISTDVAATADLSKYSVILLTGGQYASTLATRIADWVRSGGTLVATSGAGNWVAGTDIWKLESKRHSVSLAGLSYGELDGARGVHSVPGSIFRSTYDKTHPLTFGTRMGLGFREGDSFLVAPSEPGTVVARYAENPLVTGYTTEPVQKVAAGSASILAKRSGSGRIVLMCDNPVFRGFFVSQSDLLMNAIFFSKAF
ncbi:M14 family metallopeptidase [Kamptonema cortianum]|nr:M14 family metallopeptidase [Geitlerinema splendidum]MDK3155867.1 M14 family metallopeptidase [Kamptonema cortianum]